MICNFCGVARLLTPHTSFGEQPVPIAGKEESRNVLWLKPTRGCGVGERWASGGKEEVSNRYQPIPMLLLPMAMQRCQNSLQCILWDSPIDPFWVRHNWTKITGADLYECEIRSRRGLDVVAVAATNPALT